MALGSVGTLRVEACGDCAVPGRGEIGASSIIYFRDTTLKIFYEFNWPP